MEVEYERGNVLSNCRNQNEFVEEAIKFYSSYVKSKNDFAVMPPIVASALRATVQSSENRIAAWQLFIWECTQQALSCTGASRPHTSCGSLLYGRFLRPVFFHALHGAVCSPSFRLARWGEWGQVHENGGSGYRHLLSLARVWQNQ